VFSRNGDAMEARAAIRFVCCVLPILGAAIIVSSIIIVLEWALTPQLESVDRVVVSAFFLSATVIGIMLIWLSWNGLHERWTTWYVFSLEMLDVLGYTIVITGAASLLLEFTSSLALIILGGLLKYCALRLHELDEEDRRSIFWAVTRILAICCLAVGGLTVDAIDMNFVVIDVCTEAFHVVAIVVLFLNRYCVPTDPQPVAAAAGERGSSPHPSRG